MAARVLHLLQVKGRSPNTVNVCIAALSLRARISEMLALTAKDIDRPAHGDPRARHQ